MLKNLQISETKILSNPYYLKWFKMALPYQALSLIWWILKLLLISCPWPTPEMRYNQAIASKNDLNPFHFQLPNSLYNGATYRSINGTKALYLDGRSYAETPALPIQTTSFSILCWMKVLSLSEQEIHIYSDWFSPYQFRFGILKDKLCANLRRDYPKFSNIVLFCRGWASYN